MRTGAATVARPRPRRGGSATTTSGRARQRRAARARRGPPSSRTCVEVGQRGAPVGRPPAAPTRPPAPPRRARPARPAPRRTARRRRRGPRRARRPGPAPTPPRRPPASPPAPGGPARTCPPTGATRARPPAARPPGRTPRDPTGCRCRIPVGVDRHLDLAPPGNRLLEHGGERAGRGERAVGDGSTSWLRWARSPARPSSSTASRTRCRQPSGPPGSSSTGDVAVDPGEPLQLLGAARRLPARAASARRDVLQVAATAATRARPRAGRGSTRPGAPSSTATASARQNPPPLSSVTTARTRSPGSACRTNTTRAVVAERATQCPPWATAPTCSSSTRSVQSRAPSRHRPGSRASPPARRSRPSAGRSPRRLPSSRGPAAIDGDGARAVVARRTGSPAVRAGVSSALATRSEDGSCHGTFVTITPGWNSSLPLSRSALWLCSSCSHQCPTTYSGMNTVTTSRGFFVRTRFT